VKKFKEWLAHNLVGAVIGAVFVLVFVALCLLCWRTDRARVRAQQELRSLLDQREALVRGNPFPSAENLATLRDNNWRLRQQYQELLAAAEREKIVVPPMDSSQFSLELAQKVPELRRRAREANVELPEGFLFGFEEYAAARPPADKVPLLAKQLRVVETLSTMLMRSGVLGIQQFRPLSPSASPPETNAIYQVLPFELQFTCNTTALQRFLNAVSSSDLLLVVRKVQVEPSPYAVEMPTRRARPTPAGAAHPPTALEGEHVPETDNLSVTVRVDLVEFTEEAALKL
jgi:hypothetical protein